MLHKMPEILMRVGVQVVPYQEIGRVVVVLGDIGVYVLIVIIYDTIAVVQGIIHVEVWEVHH